MKLTSKRIRRHLIIGGVICMAVIIGLAAVILNTLNRMVDYYGVTMRQSEMLVRRTGVVYCQQVASFSFGVTFVCFDSERELDAFSRAH